MGYHLSIDLRQESQSIEGNYSRVTVAVYITADSGSWATWNGACNGNLVINGLSYPFSTSYSINGSTQRLYITTVTVPHNSDGTKTVSAYASFNAKPSFVGWLSASNGLTLTTIPRGSKTNFISGSEFGDTYTIKWTPAVESFTHRVYWHILTEKEHPWVLVGTGFKNQASFEIPLELCSKIPNDSSTVLTVSLETYSGTTKIYDEIKTYTITVPESVKPRITSFEIVEGNSRFPQAFRNIWVQNISKPKVISESEGVYGSTIKSIKTTFEEATYDGSIVTLNNISSDGRQKVKTVITDSRGRTIEKVTELDIEPYFEPQIKNITFAFCDVNGLPDASGKYIKITVQGNVASVKNKNVRNLKAKWKKQATGTFSTKAMNTNSYEFESSVVISGFDSSLTYELGAELEDAYASSTSTIFTGKIVISRYPTGEGVTFFEEAKEEGLNCREVRYDLNSDEIAFVREILNNPKGLNRLGKILQTIGLRIPIKIEKNGQFDVVKYSDGTCEVSCQITQITPVNMVQWNNSWWRWIGNLRLPYGLFKRVDNIQVSGHCNGGVYTCGSGKKTDVLQIVLLMPTPAWTANQVPTELPFVRVYGRYKE